MKKRPGARSDTGFPLSVTLLRERVASFDQYPFSIPTIRALDCSDAGRACRGPSARDGHGGELRAARVDACLAYVALLRAHIDKDDGIVFPLAEAVLDEQAVQGLRRGFDVVEAEQGPDATIAGAETALGRLDVALEAAA